MIPIDKVIVLTESYPILALIILGFFGSEALLTIMFLAGSGNIDLSFLMIFIFGFIIVLILDGVYYKIGKLDFIKHITPGKLKRKKYNAVFDYIKKSTHENVFLILLISKFFYGLRQMAVVYLGYHNYPYNKFFKRDSVALFIYFSIMMPIAWLLGKGIGASFGSVKEVEIMIALALAFIFIIYFAGKLILARLAKKYKRSN